MEIDFNRTAELVVQIQNGDDSAFEELYHLTSKRAFFIAKEFVKNEDDAEDILQDSYIKALAKINELENPETFEWIKTRSKEYIKLMHYYKCAIMEIETKLNILNGEYSLQLERNPINNIKSRLKDPESIIDKLGRGGFPKTLASMEENILDIAGVRVICMFEGDVYTIADALLSQDDVTLVKKKDYISSPKPNGYRSLHLIVSIPIFLTSEKRNMTVEIQLRTVAMDCWASLEHQLRYKKDNLFTEEMERELLLCAKMSADLDRRMDGLRLIV